MLRNVIWLTLFAAMANLVLFVPQYNLTNDDSQSYTSTIDESEGSVESILTSICEEIFDVEYPPINEDAHFLEQDYLAKRVLRIGVNSIVSALIVTRIIESFADSQQQLFAASTEVIIHRSRLFIVRLTPF